jgi:hypothetical protein
MHQQIQITKYISIDSSERERERERKRFLQLKNMYSWASYLSAVRSMYWRVLQKMWGELAWADLVKSCDPLQYAFVVPVVANATHGFLYPAGAAQDVQDNWCFHLLLLGALRYICQQLWTSYSRLHCLVKKHQINACGIEFEQVDREFHSYLNSS